MGELRWEFDAERKLLRHASGLTVRVHRRKGASFAEGEVVVLPNHVSLELAADLLAEACELYALELVH